MNMDTQETTFINEVNAIYERLGVIAPHELLGIKRGADTEELKHRYHALARKFHPDRYAIAGDKALERKLVVIFDAITKAYNRLREEKSSGAEEHETSTTEQGKEMKRAAAFEQYRRGIQEYKAGNYWQAAEALRWATRLDPGRAEYWSHLSLSLSGIPKRLKEAEEAALEAIRLEPYKDEHYINLGRVYLKAGLRLRAKKQFEKALRYNPGNDYALRYLNDLEKN